MKIIHISATIWQIVTQFWLVTDLDNWPFRLLYFRNPRWPQPPFWKIEKSPYPSNGLTDFYEIWHGDASTLLTALTVKMLIFKNPWWRRSLFWQKIEKSFTFAICCRPSVCMSVCRLSSVTFVHPTQAVQIFGNISTALGTLAILDIHWKLHGDLPRGTPPPGELNTRGVAKYSDFGPIDGYISETVQDRR